MDDKIRESATDLLELSNGNGWRRGTEFLHSWLNPPARRRLAVIRAPECDSALSAWLEHAAPSWQILDLTDTPTAPEIWLAEWVVIGFPCGGLPPASLVSDLASGAQSRPMGATFVALTGAERIESEGDLQLVESTARRWLLAPAADGNPILRIADAGGLLWSSAPPSGGSLVARIVEDMESLKAAISGPLAESLARQLDRRRLVVAFELAESEAEPVAETTGAEPYRCPFDLQNELSELREQSISRFRSDSDLLESSIRICCDTLEEDLAAGLPRLVEASGRAMLHADSADEAYRRYYRGVVEKWQSRPRAAIDQWRSSVEQLRQSIDSSGIWPQVRQTAGGDWPDTMLRALSAEEIVIRPPNASAAVFSERRGHNHGLMVTAVGAVLGMGVGMITRLGMRAALVGGGFGLAAGEILRRQRDDADQRQVLLEAMRLDIGRTVKSTRSFLADSVAERTDQLRRKLSDGFAAVARAIEGAVQPPPPTSNSGSGRDQLAGLRRAAASILKDDAV